MPEVPVNGKVLEWARLMRNLSVDGLDDARAAVLSRGAGIVFDCADFGGQRIIFNAAAHSARVVVLAAHSAGYSWRKARTGSTRMARRAGM